ncbi:hypothetical protein C8R43DRAFT_1127706 [Mycena crocata]|nr:hypothetical protein C8R43DRAFT_1127706 [Mycena crocata]
MHIMRTSTAILLLFGSVSAVAHHHEPKPECATCAEKIVEAKNQVYTLVFQFPDETSNTTLCAYQEMREGKEPRNEGYCGYDGHQSKGDLVDNKDDLEKCPPAVGMEQCPYD